MSRCIRRLTRVNCGGWAMSSCRSSAVIRRILVGCSGSAIRSLRVAWNALFGTRFHLLFDRFLVVEKETDFSLVSALPVVMRMLQDSRLRRSWVWWGAFGLPGQLHHLRDNPPALRPHRRQAAARVENEGLFVVRHEAMAVGGSRGFVSACPCSRAGQVRRQQHSSPHGRLDPQARLAGMSSRP